MTTQSFKQLSDSLPPLILGTAAFGYQFHDDPFALPTTALVQRSFSHGIRAFDTSPYYGPAEGLLGKALESANVRENYARKDYFIITKAGRIAASTFDYSPAWISKSVSRSLKRLHTDYLDVVYCHDVEFVSPAEVLGAVKELRRIRDATGAVRNIGASAYPVNVLCDIAEMILEETGEPLDIVQSYANFNLQNTRLVSEGLGRLIAAGVKVVTNASPLGMGLLRRQGVPIGAMGDFHPSPPGLREAIERASRFCDKHGEVIEILALRYAIENWMIQGASVGTTGTPPSPGGVPIPSDGPSKRRLGVTVLGSSLPKELEDTMLLYQSILSAFEHGRGSENELSSHEQSLKRKQEVLNRAKDVKQVLREWYDVTWSSPPPGFINETQSSNRQHGEP